MNNYLLAVMSVSFVMGIIGCSKEGYSSDEAITRGDIVIQSEVENFERFDDFLQNLSSNKGDTIRITGYTHEGDPIFVDLKYDGKVIQYTHDNTHDDYAGDNNKGIEKDVCTEIIEKEDEVGYTEFILTGCAQYDKSLMRIEEENVKTP